MRRLRVSVAVALAVAATMTATAFATLGTNLGTIRGGSTAGFAGTGWSCRNLGTSVTCRHGSHSPYLTLSNRHGTAFLVIVHPAAGRAGLPSRVKQRGEKVPVYVFSSTPR